jgi:hypothetical protein
LNGYRFSREKEYPMDRTITLPAGEELKELEAFLRTPPTWALALPQIHGEAPRRRIIGRILSFLLRRD